MTFTIRVKNSSGLLVTDPSAPSVVTSQPIIGTLPTTFIANVTFANSIALFANGSSGTNGQVLTTTGNSVHWADVSILAGVSRVDSGSGLTGGPVIGIGTLSVLANTGIISNSSGLFVNTSYISTLTSNNTSFVGSISAANVVSNSQLQANLSAYQTISGLAGNVVLLAANSAAFIGSIAAANVVTVTTLAANISTVNASITANAGSAYINAVSYVDGKSFVNTAQLSANLSNYQTTAGLASNVAILTSNNTSFVGSVSAANVVSNSQLQANLSAISGTITANADSAYSKAVSYVDGKNYVNTSQLSSNLANYQTSAGLASNVAVLTSNNTSFIGSVSAANVVSNSQLQANLTTISGTITANASAAYSNAVSYVDGKSFVNTSQLSSNLANYQTTAGLAGNVATLTSNNTSFVGSVSAANVVSNSQLQANLANYQTSAGLASNVAVLTSNNSTNFAGQPASFYANADNLTSGTLPNARLSSAVVNTSGNFIISGTRTHNANLVVNSGIIANGSVGIAGQTLASNGSSVYWARTPYNITVDFSQGAMPSNGTITVDNGTSSNITINDVIHTIGNNNGNLQFTVQFLFSNGSTQNVAGLTTVTCNTSSRTTTSATSNNIAASGTILQLVIANTSGSPNNASFTIRGTRP